MHPCRTLATQEGNSLEMSLVLVSLLVGFGFQAYVVCGWARREVATMDRTKETCRFIMEKKVICEKYVRNRMVTDVVLVAVISMKFVIFLGTHLTLNVT